MQNAGLCLISSLLVLSDSSVAAADQMVPEPISVVVDVDKSTNYAKASVSIKNLTQMKIRVFRRDVSILQKNDNGSDTIIPYFDCLIQPGDQQGGYVVKDRSGKILSIINDPPAKWPFETPPPSPEVLIVAPGQQLIVGDPARFADACGERTTHLYHVYAIVKWTYADGAVDSQQEHIVKSSLISVTSP